jgi:hypothetical protein
MTTTNDKYGEFLWGFAKGADIDRSEAEAQWAGWSTQLSDLERSRFEQQGEDSGFSEGQFFANHYPAGTLHNYETGEVIRQATMSETVKSRAEVAAGRYEGVILAEIEGQEVHCYVAD